MKHSLKNKCRRAIALALGVATMASAVPVTTFAASDSVSISFGYMYQSDGSQIKYQGSFQGTHGSDGSAGKAMTQIYADGKEAYCIEPGESLHTGDSLKSESSDTWNGLSSAKKEAVKMALAFGKPGNADGLKGSGDSKHLATQMVLWEFICGYRNTSSYERSNGSIYNAFCKDGANKEVATAYNTIVKEIQGWKTTPSFANGGTYDMRWENGKYTVTLNDANRVLDKYSVSTSDSHVKATNSGNSLILTSDVYMKTNPTITLTKTSNISGSAKLVAYGSASLQDVVIGVSKLADVSANLKVNTPGGTLKVVKKSEDGVISGIQMHVQGDNYDKFVTTGSDGSLQLEGILPGKYTVTENASDYYEPQDPQTITIKGGEISTVTFSNVLKRGNLSVTKTSEDGFIKGMKFRLFGKSASGANVDVTTTTDDNGVATFNNILIAGATGYTLEEVDTAIRYVIPDAQNIRVNWKETTATQVNNILKKFNVTIEKKDAEKGSAQGDATLGGAMYGLFKGGELVETMTTDKDGRVTSEYHVCGDDWSIRELASSEGYLIDESTYHIGSEAKNYKVEFNSAPEVGSKEQVIKGNVSIIKHTDDGSTQIETPEAGAEFQIYLTSAESYDAAKDSEKDTLVCNEDGFAKSKDLPYGIYTIHQTKGWEETEMMKDFTVFIAENGKTYKYLINNAPYSAYIKVVKADKETGKTIPLTGAGFEIYDEAGKGSILKFV